MIILEPWECLAGRAISATKYYWVTPIRFHHEFFCPQQQKITRLLNTLYDAGLSRFLLKISEPLAASFLSFLPTVRLSAI